MMEADVETRATQRTGYADVVVERVLGLPFGSIEASRGNDPALDAVLKIVETFPWVLTVADQGFCKKSADAEILRAAAQEMLTKAKELETGPSPVSYPLVTLGG